MTDDDREITATVLRERNRLSSFIRRRVRDRADADDILQDVFSEFVEAYHLPAPIERVSAWLFRVARNRIVDLFRKKREQSLEGIGGKEMAQDEEYRLDLLLPAPDGGPEAAYARSVLLTEMQAALDELPADQREVFVAHELEGVSFKELTQKSGVPMNTLLARKRYAVLHLRDRLQSIYDEF
jgi:RNA polymerase sigma factor (sigma-70 family)